MSDLAKWKVHGPVETLRSEFATWDPDKTMWQPGQHFTATSFRLDGKISVSESHNPDRSIAHSRWLYDDEGRLTESNSWLNDGDPDRVLYSYDEAGRHIRTIQLSHDNTEMDLEICSYEADGKRTKVRFLGQVRAAHPSSAELSADTGYGIEGTDVALGAPGATMMTTTYDEEELPVEVILQDADHSPLRQATLRRDSAGRVVRLDISLGGSSLFENHPDRIALKERDRIDAFIKQSFGDVFSSMAYSYDALGRLLERTDTMGSLGGTRTTYRYNDHDDPIEEITESTSREASIDENGIAHYSPHVLTVQHNRLEYRYDAYGNWTERIVSIRPELNPKFQLSNIERRAITYHSV